MTCLTYRFLLMFAVAVLVPPAKGQTFLAEPEEAFAEGFLDTLSYSAGPPPVEFVPQWHDMITNLPSDWVRAPGLTFRTSNLGTIAGVAGLTGGLIVTDGRTYEVTESAYNTSPWVRSAANVLHHVGDGSVHLAIAGGFALYGWLGEDSRALRTASQTIEALVASGITVQVLKRMTGRESPHMASKSGGAWHFFPNMKEYQKHQPRYYAFPSGHITTTMATVTVLIENYPEVAWLRPVGYTVVGLVGVSLVSIGYHWYSDLPLGIALGYLFGKIASSHQWLEPSSSDEDFASHLSIMPLMTERGAGLALQFSF